MTVERDEGFRAGVEAAAAVVDQCNCEGPYNAIGAASRIRALLPADAGQPDGGVEEAERRGEKRAIARLVNVSQAIALQAGVGGRETAGAVVSHLATSPDEIAPFVAGDLSPLDFAGDWMRGGCLSWHAMNGKVVYPDDLAASAPAARENES